MKYLLHTFLRKNNETGDVIKFEIFTNQRTLNIYGKVPEGTCQVIRSVTSPDGEGFKITHLDFDIQPLYDENASKYDIWYSDDADRVSLEMIIDYLNR